MINMAEENSDSVEEISVQETPVVTKGAKGLLKFLFYY